MFSKIDQPCFHFDGCSSMYSSEYPAVYLALLGRILEGSPAHIKTRDDERCCAAGAMGSEFGLGQVGAANDDCGGSRDGVKSGSYRLELSPLLS